MKSDGRGLWTCTDIGLAHLEGQKWRFLSAQDGLLENDCNSMALSRFDDVWYAYQRLAAFSLIQNPIRLEPAHP